jgi:hypothetical protein
MQLQANDMVEGMGVCFIHVILNYTNWITLFLGHLCNCNRVAGSLLSPLDL